MERIDHERISAAQPSVQLVTPDIPDEVFDRLRNILKSLKNFNIDIYKDKCIRRRIGIRIRARRCLTAEEYCDLVLTDELELERLLKVLTIHVSNFFRNPPTFSKLTEDIFPYLFEREQREARGGIKLWSVGCAGGEEPYTLAIILKDSFNAKMKKVPVEIVATDVDRLVLEQAIQGVYPEERLKDVAPQLLERYFETFQGRYRLANVVREMVVFRQGDLFDGDHYPESDLILCRNVLIYFERIQQERIIRRFAEVLGSGGVLVLGKSETLVGDTRRFFQTICPFERIYRVV
jgi:chemotaxis protein methyltransferase CheR